MSSTFPTIIDSLTDGIAASALNSPNHTTITNDANDAIEKIETKIGVGTSMPSGDNLLLNPEFQVGATPNLPLYWDKNGAVTLTIATDDLFPVLGGNKVTINIAGDYRGFGILGSATNWLKVKPSTFYTFSIDYKKISGETFNLGIRTYLAGNFIGGPIYTDIFTSEIATRCSVSFLTDAAVDNLQIYIGGWDVSKTGVLDISHPKFEEGSVATPFEPVFSRARLKSKLITATRDMTAASGDVAYTGLDFTPTSINAIACIDATAAFSKGFADSTKAGASVDQYGANVFVADVNNLLHVYIDAANHQSAIVKTYDTNVGLTLTWTKTGSPTGIAKLIFLCLR